ncbi:DUF881 domain-containing protein [Halobacillus salinarum]|uniref:DUF881 domain-containing protein n=1 Tax=Halobacillus salinarum TaxID=2932257 RepID=A0ABY4EFA4_9BACI|nr:DUF881 domain-containing protein [Halobacillus salinarum]UOQ43132.1 DUF881 domain-containing protein [Halobacillus salinarum]
MDKGKSLILSLVLLASGFLIAYSYQQTKSRPEMVQLNDSQWEKRYFYKKQLIEVEERNKNLREELSKKRAKVQQIEDNLAKSEQVVADFVQRKKKLQLLAGELPVEGKGVKVVLSDADYVPERDNVNNYIVHEGHIHKVINELLTAGAKAIAINGQRVFADSYIACTGPVITLDGVQHPAPFVITAIGDQEVLASSLELKQGIIDQLEKENIQISLSIEETITMRARLSAEG